MSKSCYCTSARNYEDCCGQYIDGDAIANNPEALMRSRYSAYCQGKVDYIATTMRGQALQGYDKQDAKAWATSANWLGLQVKLSQIKDDKGYVEFIASYESNNQKHFIHELSSFEHIDGHWYYVSGKQMKPKSNDSCLCGSGKKYKRCCMQR